MNKVYLVIEEWSADFDGGHDINVFYSQEDAQKFTRKRIEEIKKEDFGYDNELEEDYYYSGYIDGEYASNHTSIYIEEKEVK